MNALFFLEDRPLIDVRSEIEFARGSFPGAVNLPILNTEERHQVGLCYKQQGPQQAIALGTKLVSGKIKEERVEAWCQFLQENPQSHLYCFRGGLRSQIAQQWIQERGWQVPRIPGGYKLMRRFLVSVLKTLGSSLDFLVIGGKTGVGKTEFLEESSPRWRTCDLEALAHHRGSVFGRRDGISQPTQVDFENALGIHLLRLAYQTPDSTGPVLIENESRQIGRLVIPDPLFQKMQISPLIVLEGPREERIATILRSYVRERISFLMKTSPTPLEDYGEEVRKNILTLSSRLGGLRTKECLEERNAAFTLHLQGGPEEIHGRWIGKLLDYYYDPTYDRHLQRNLHRVLFKGTRRELHQFLRERERENQGSPFLHPFSEDKSISL